MFVSVALCRIVGVADTALLRVNRFCNKELCLADLLYPPDPQRRGPALDARDCGRQAARAKETGSLTPCEQPGGVVLCQGDRVFTIRRIRLAF